MQKHKYVQRVELDSLKSEPVDMTKFAITAHDKGPAPYFRMELKKSVERILNQKEYLRSDGRPWNLDKDGLRIYTTLDPIMKAHVEKSDRKSTRLNSSHVAISYAVFCLK